MVEDDLRQLLSQADRAAGPAPAPRINLADRVRRSARRRRMAETAGPMAAVLILGVVLLHWANRNTNPSPTSTSDSINVAQNLENQTPPTSVEVSQFQAEIAQLRVRADIQMQVVRELLDLEKQQTELAELERQLAAIPDPLEEVRRQVEQAAYTVVYHADLKYTRMNLKESAIEEFQRVIQLYPQTRWAAVAQAKLSEIRFNQKGNIL